MISIYLDDLRTPIKSPSKNTKWTVVRNFEEFIDLVEKTVQPETDRLLSKL